MQFIDLAFQQNRILPDIEAGIKTVLNHGQYIMGPEIGELEKVLAEYVSSKHAISCASGTDALIMALMAHGIGPGDAVFTTPFTFIATSEVISLLGAIPVFVDIDPSSFNISSQQLARCIEAVKRQDRNAYPIPKAVITKQVRPNAIIAVDLFGLPANYNEINTIAQKHQLAVIEDAAQSLGADYMGRKACSLADIGCTSFFPAKPLGCYGDGGMCFTDSDSLYELMESLRVHGKGSHKYDNVRIGLNGRMDTLQAAVLLAKFEIFPDEIKDRQKVAERYTNLLQSCISLQTPSVPMDITSAWAQYSVLAENAARRKEIMDNLKAAGIPSAIYYPRPLHLQTAFAQLGYRKGDFPVSEEISERIFSIPMHPYLSMEDQKLITDQFTSAISSG